MTNLRGKITKGSTFESDWRFQRKKFLLIFFKWLIDIGVEPSVYELWDCKTCQAKDGFTYCQWPDQFNTDGGCLPNVSDGTHIPCGEEDGDVIVRTCPGIWLCLILFVSVFSILFRKWNLR